MSKRISVIIPTYNRVVTLGITIKSLIEQTYPDNLYEIIIADNNSSDNTKELVESIAKDSAVPVKYLFEKRPGAHFARNTAAQMSDSEYLYFTDDDMIADPDMLENILKVFDLDYNIAVTGGKVLPKWEFDPPEWLLKYFQDGTLSLINKPEKLIITNHDFGIYSCHQAMLRSVFFECGGFNPDIEKDKLIGNGETGLNIKILKKGYNFAYTADSVTRHIIPRSRMTQKYLNNRFSNQGICDGFTNFRKSEYSKKNLFRLIFNSHLPLLLKSFSDSFLNQIKGNSLWRLKRANFHYHYNRIKFDMKLISNDEWRKFVLRNEYFNY
ncbi:MAG TPA: glycosyltransferase family 2 protein [Ignavibacteria bacterium]|nr:glycosyltransferase family 2 protein [Ignavibacteria bacterium]